VSFLADAFSGLMELLQGLLWGHVFCTLMRYIVRMLDLLFHLPIKLVLGDPLICLYMYRFVFIFELRH